MKIVLYTWWVCLHVGEQMVLGPEHRTLAWWGCLHVGERMVLGPEHRTLYMPGKHSNPGLTFSFFYFEKGSCYFLYVSQAVLEELLILLPQLPGCWNYRLYELEFLLLWRDTHHDHGNSYKENVSLGVAYSFRVWSIFIMTGTWWHPGRRGAGYILIRRQQEVFSVSHWVK